MDFRFWHANMFPSCDFKGFVEAYGNFFDFEGLSGTFWELCWEFMPWFEGILLKLLETSQVLRDFNDLSKFMVIYVNLSEIILARFYMVWAMVYGVVRLQIR